MIGIKHTVKQNMILVNHRKQPNPILRITALHCWFVVLTCTFKQYATEDIQPSGSNAKAQNLDLSWLHSLEATLFIKPYQLSTTNPTSNLFRSYSKKARLFVIYLLHSLLPEDKEGYGRTIIPKGEMMEMEKKELVWIAPSYFVQKNKIK